MKRLVLPVLLAMIMMTPVQARDKQHVIDLSTESCLDANQTTAGMLKCFTRAEEDWDKELNRVYKALQKQLKPAGQDALKQAQLAWIGQRDKEFALINAIHEQMEGTMWIPVMANKRADVVKARALELQDYFNLLTKGAL